MGEGGDRGFGICAKEFWLSDDERWGNAALAVVAFAFHGGVTGGGPVLHGVWDDKEGRGVVTRIDECLADFGQAIGAFADNDDCLVMGDLVHANIDLPARRDAVGAIDVLLGEI